MDAQLFQHLGRLCIPILARERDDALSKAVICHGGILGILQGLLPLGGIRQRSELLELAHQLLTMASRLLEAAIDIGRIVGQDHVADGPCSGEVIDVRGLDNHDAACLVRVHIIEHGVEFTELDDSKDSEGCREYQNAGKSRQ
ncbi:hypothetical protein D3C86_1686890 [compost metagenome]